MSIQTAIVNMMSIFDPFAVVFYHNTTSCKSQVLRQN